MGCWLVHGLLIYLYISSPAKLDKQKRIMWFLVIFGPLINSSVFSRLKHLLIANICKHWFHKYSRLIELQLLHINKWGGVLRLEIKVLLCFFVKYVYRGAPPDDVLQNNLNQQELKASLVLFFWWGWRYCYKLLGFLSRFIEFRGKRINRSSIIGNFIRMSSFQRIIDANFLEIWIFWFHKLNGIFTVSLQSQF